MHASPYKTTVTVAAASKDLTHIDTVKAELGINSNTHDAQLLTFIHQASAAIVGYLGREIAQATVVDYFRSAGFVSVEALRLSRYPVASITTIVENGTTLVAADHEMDAETGIIYRLDGDNRSSWALPSTPLAITYVGGYELLEDLPHDIERAALDLVKLRWFARQRDPLVKSLDVVDVGAETYWIDAASSSQGGLPPSVTALLNPYCRIEV